MYVYIYTCICMHACIACMYVRVCRPSCMTVCLVYSFVPGQPPLRPGTRLLLLASQSPRHCFTS